MNETVLGVNALIERAKVRLRNSSNTLHSEFEELVRAAMEDMETRGNIDVKKLLPETATASGMNPLAVRAVMLYCKGQFGIVNNKDECERYQICYENVFQQMSLCETYRKEPK